jgi:hypothetical protein
LLLWNCLGGNALLLASAAIGIVAIACGSDATKAEAQAPIIVTQPENQAVGVGQTALFSVEAISPTGGTVYQWYWNGSRVAGANLPSFATRPAEVADAGSRFKVSISNGYGTVASLEATLTVKQAPRSPLAGDLRFQGVDAVPFRKVILESNIPGGDEFAFTGVAGSPVVTGTGLCAPGFPQSCSWRFVLLALPVDAPEPSILYASHPVGGLEADLDAFAVPNGVITSLDVEDENGTYVLSRLKTAKASGFDATRHSVPESDLGNAVAQEGAEGRVVTAVSFHANNAYYLSYGWAGDPGTVYETKVTVASPAATATEAGNLAASGYILTALGRDGAGGVVLVGTRVSGDSMARPLEVLVDTAPYLLLERGFAIVGQVFDASTGSFTYILEQ